MMRMLLPLGVLLMAIGMAGSATACFGGSVFDGREAETLASRMDETDDAAANRAGEDGDATATVLAPLSGLALAVGLVCVGIGIGNWRRPIPSAARPANPYSDQPGTRGDPPVGQV